MDFFKRIGTDRHKYKLEFYIKRLAFNKNLPGKVYLSIRRGDHKVNTENILPIQDKICNFKHEKLVFPGLTLFYQESQKKYQEKMGEIKVILKTDNQEKKLLGVVPFDVAQFANQPETKTFKVKKQLEQTPAALKGYIAFQVFIQFIGEGSQASRSLAKDEKGSGREDSPFARITGCFGGVPNQSSENRFKRQADSEEIESSQMSEKRKDRRKRHESEQEEDQNEIFNGRKNRHIKPDDPDVNYLHKYGKNKSKPKDTQKFDEEDDIFNNKRPENKKNVKRGKKESSDQGSDGIDEDNEDKIFGRQKKGQKVKVTPKKNQLKHETYQQTLTEKVEKEKVNEVKIFNNGSTGNVQPKQDFFFDDPATYPQKYKSSKKVEQNMKKDEKDFPQSESQQIINKDMTSQRSVETPNRSKKVKQNTINFQQKQTKQIKSTKIDMIRSQEINQHKTEKNKNDDFPFNQKVVNDFSANSNQKASELSNKSKAEKFDPPKQLKKAEQTSLELSKQKKSYQAKAEQAETYKKDLQQKTRQLSQLENKANITQQLRKKLSETELQLKQTIQQNSQLKGNNAFLQKEVTRLKSEMQDMKREMNKTQSFFRETENVYQRQTQQVDLQEQIKRLEKQKNEYLLTLQKEREKSKKDLKRFNQEIEKQKLKFEQYEGISKGELKKLKDEMISKIDSIDLWKEKLKEKGKENEIILKENNLLNSSNIQLKEKYAFLKLKICDKLNEANEQGEQLLMDTLTDLNEYF